MFDGRFRKGVDRVVRPVGSALVRTGLAPDHLTLFGLILSVPTAIAIGSGRLGLGLGLLIFSAVPDLLDGALAKASGRSTVRGAFFDSVCDRVTDTFMLGGLAWYLQDTRGGHIVLLPFALLGVSLLISYLRAKAESLGFDAKGGLMERAERIILLCAGLAFSVVLIPILWIMLVLSIVTAVQRFWKVWRQATVAEGLGAARRVAGPATTPVASQRAAGHAAAKGHAPAANAAAPESSYARAERGTRFVAGSEVPLQPVSARWRAWREANGWFPRNERYARGSHRDGAGERWRQRRLARKQVTVDTEPRRRGSRRP